MNNKKIRATKMRKTMRVIFLIKFILTSPKLIITDANTSAYLMQRQSARQ